MPEAIKCGMTPEEFWYGDMRLLAVYQRQYYSNASYMAWLTGYYNYVAFGTTMSNAFAKKGAKKAEYPKWIDPMAKYSKPKMTAENIEEEFRKQQVEQGAWLFNR